MKDTVFDNFIDNQKIYPKKVSLHELAWQIKDMDAVLQWLGNNNQVVLGGDVLSWQEEYTYDNWYYNYDYDVPLLDNVNESISVAKQYISNYMTINGDCYYVILVLK